MSKKPLQRPSLQPGADPYTYDADQFLTERRRDVCGHCPYQIICVGGQWPKTACQCTRCYTIWLEPAQDIDDTVRCTVSSFEPHRRAGWSWRDCLNCGELFKTISYRGYHGITLIDTGVF